MSRSRVGSPLRLLPTENIGIANILDGEDAEADKHLKGSLPLITCECGAEILLLPDLHAMDRAIDAHVTEHRKKGRLAKKTENRF
jgi:hypothetical protein